MTLAGLLATAGALAVRLACMASLLTRMGLTGRLTARPTTAVAWTIGMLAVAMLAVMTPIILTLAAAHSLVQFRHLRICAWPRVIRALSLGTTLRSRAVPGSSTCLPLAPTAAILRPTVLGSGILRSTAPRVTLLAT